MKTPTTPLAWLIWCRTLNDTLAADKIKRATMSRTHPLAIGQATIVCALLQAEREKQGHLTDYELGKWMAIGTPSTKSLVRVAEMGFISEIRSAKGPRKWKITSSKRKEAGRIEADLKALVDRTNRRIEV